MVTVRLTVWRVSRPRGPLLLAAPAVLGLLLVGVVAPEALKDNGDASLFGNEAFKDLWQEVNNSVSEVCANKTFADLIDFEKAKREKCVPNYNI